MPDHPQLAPPIAQRRPTRFEIHGDVRWDDYFWLRQRDDPAVLAYLEAENAYTEAMMAHTVALQATLYEELRGRIQENDATYPDQIDDFFYYQRTETGRQYPIFCRRQGGMDAPESVLLDVNELAAGHPYAHVGNFRVSPDHRLLAYSFDGAGDETYTLLVKDLATGNLFAERIRNTYYGLEWGNDSATLYYTVLDAAKRPYQLMRHRLGADPAHDEVLVQEDDTRYEVKLRKSKCQTYVIVHLKSNTTSEEWLIDAADPLARPRIIERRRLGVEYSVSHHEGQLYITTNDEALNFRLMQAPAATPGRPFWREFVPHRPDVLLQGTDAFARHLVLYEREAGLRQVRVISWETGDQTHIAMPEPVYAIARHANPNYAATHVRFYYESLVTPETVYDFDMDAHTLHLRKQETVRGYDPARYETLRIWARAPDGVQVPISLVHRKGLALDGGNPTLLRGYGAYGASWDAYFEAGRISLLERGFVFALAHVRGGSDMGRAWYEQGKLFHKKNTFTDFIACAEHLIAQGYTSPARLTIYGQSAGGLLVGAVVNMRPDLFAGVIAGVPFVDVINTMLDPSIPLTTQEYDEWGDPADPAQYAYMRSYSPYDNAPIENEEDTRYPHVLATAGLNDPRVQYWEPAKWVAKLRRLRNNPNRVLLKTDMTAGHSGASGRFDSLRDTAFEYAFLLDAVGLT